MACVAVLERGLVTDTPSLGLEKDEEKEQKNGHARLKLKKKNQACI